MMNHNTIEAIHRYQKPTNQMLSKVIQFASTVLLVVGIASVCCISVSDNTPLSTIVSVYGLLVTLICVGALGIVYTQDPDAVKSRVYAIVYAIQTEMEIRNSTDINDIEFRYNHTILETLRIFYGIGLDNYFLYHL